MIHYIYIYTHYGNLNLVPDASPVGVGCVVDSFSLEFC